jgi:electron transfer flavoprotein alpha subunit
VKAIVLVKQVPDLRHGGVGVRPDGTIDRAAAVPVTNPTDLHALEAAVQLADEVVALSMGPATAEATLRDALAAGAHRAMLLCDHAFAGSDTWATANALAAAVLHDGGADLVLCGTSAIDGETGQVGPSVAQRLGWPQVTMCEALARDGDGDGDGDGHTIVARRIVEGGYEQLRVPLPAVVSIGETGFAPRYPTMMQRRHAATATITRLTAADIGLDSDKVGLAASPTKVAHMTPAPLPDRACRMVGDGFGYDELVRELRERGALTPANHESANQESAGQESDSQRSGGQAASSQATLAPDLPAFAPVTPSAPIDAAPFAGAAQVWVVCDTEHRHLDRASRELLTKAAELAPSLGGGVAAVLLTGSDEQPAHPAEQDPAEQDPAGQAAEYGADIVYVAADSRLAPYRTEPWARVLADAARAHRPQALLLAATTTGRDLAPRVASMLDTGLAADCTDLYVADWSRRGTAYPALVHMVRPAMAGGVLATCLCPTARPQMATVRPGVFTPHPAPRPRRIESLPVTLTDSDQRVQVIDRHIGSADVSLADADVVVAGGAGCTADSWQLVEALAAAIGGRVAASRGAVEAGLAERAQQVGQTGITVRPRLYLACGISGALQHAIGMHDSATIVAVNRDPEAVIFKVAHYGIVGDVATVLPQLTASLVAVSPR